MGQLRWLGLDCVSRLSGERRRSRFQRRSLRLERLGRIKTAKRIVSLGSGWQWATDGRSSRAYDRAERAEALRRNAWPGCMATDVALSVNYFLGRNSENYSARFLRCHVSEALGFCR